MEGRVGGNNVIGLRAFRAYNIYVIRLNLIEINSKMFFFFFIVGYILLF